MIDVHAHLQSEVFKDDLKDVLLRAKSNGITGVICASVDFSDAVKCLELGKNLDQIHSAIGLAPYSDLSEIDKVIQLIKDSPDIVAVGEIGLDYPYKKYPEQVEPFKKQIALAMELDLPVVVHSRSAGKYCFEILQEMKAEKVVMHAFGGSIKTARKAFDSGFSFSIPVTVLRSPEKQKLAREIPEELLLLETDSPVLNPEKGRNEPANLVKSRDFIAELRGVKPEVIGKLTEKNAKSLFKI